MKSAATAYTRCQYGHIAGNDNVLQQTALLYQWLLDDLDRCHNHIRRGDCAARGAQIDHALSILTVLSKQAATMMEDHPDTTLPGHLLELYDSCLFCLMSVVADNNIAHLDKAWSMINTVKSAWDELAAQQTTAARG